MALDFPTNPTDGQVYGNYYYSATKGAWRSTTDFNTPSLLRNANITTASASTVPLTVQGYASQSANLQEWENSSATVLTRIDSAGNIYAPSITSSAISNFTAGGASLSLKASANDHTYMQFYARTASQSTRSGWLGYGTAAGNNLSLVNEIASGNLILTPGSGGQVTLPSQTYAPGSIVQVQHVRTNSVVDVTAQDITAITGLSISFTPKFANSKILLTSMINSNAVYVTSYGFLKDGTSLGTTNPNSNTLSSVWTGYSGQGTGTTTNMYGAYTEWLENATNTTARTYAAGITSSWGGTIYTVRVNDRSDNVMRSYSSMTIYEIAQ